MLFRKGVTQVQHAFTIMFIYFVQSRTRSKTRCGDVVNARQRALLMLAEAFYSSVPIDYNTK